jgi:SNF2 family DNA or RNA helicase
VEPRAYQLVPLLMALRLTTVRLLIADDVGIGKTIEAGLIVRELMDRGEVARLAVLCPPHLVEQWQGELQNRFNLQAVALTSASASRWSASCRTAWACSTSTPSSWSAWTTSRANATASTS